MPVRGTCSRCGDCCKKPVVMSSYMLEDNSCKFLRFEDGFATCPFREGLREPKKAYNYWKKYCVPFPKDQSDLRSVLRCTYYWKVINNG